MLISRTLHSNVEEQCGERNPSIQVTKQRDSATGAKTKTDARSSLKYPANEQMLSHVDLATLDKVSKLPIKEQLTYVMKSLPLVHKTYERTCHFLAKQGDLKKVMDRVAEQQTLIVEELKIMKEQVREIKSQAESAEPGHENLTTQTPQRKGSSDPAASYKKAMTMLPLKSFGDAEKFFNSENTLFHDARPYFEVGSVRHFYI